MIWKLRDLVEWTRSNNTRDLSTDAWMPTRPLNYQFESLRERLRAVWLVFTGQAEAVIWPEDEKKVFGESK